MNDNDTYKWMVIENIATILGTVIIISAGLFAGAGGVSYGGLALLLNINYIRKK